MNTPEMRRQCADRLSNGSSKAAQMSAFVGLDGFVDEILHVVDKRQSADKYERLTTIAKFSQRLAGAAGQSTNVELVTQLTKLGGNGPIMANALATFGMKVAYLGILGYPSLHPVFNEFAKRAEVFSIAEPGYTDALEFADGKIMLGKHSSLRQMNWQNINERFGREKFAGYFGSSDLIGFVNWTMLTAMSDIWRFVLREICPQMKGPRRKLFVDLADPEKRTAADISDALGLISEFQKYFDVILGLNEKEGHEIAENLGVKSTGSQPEHLLQLCRDVHARLKIDTLVIHPTAYALASGPDGCAIVEGPFVATPKITTGAGDHFNSGFCLGKLLGLSTQDCVLTGVTTSGFYVRTGESPKISDLVALLNAWP